MKKIASLSSVILITFLSLIFYNYLSTQKAIREEKTSTFKTEILSFPKTIEIGSQALVEWKVETPEGLITTATTIYWGYESTPSALKEYDSPQAAGYSSHPADYETGGFLLPGKFDIGISPDKIGQIFFRSYALVQGRHLWSEEKSISITPKNK